MTGSLGERPGGQSATIDGQRYDLAQFHFHNPSEHLVDGQNTPLELHFVHKNAAGDPKASDGATVSGVRNVRALTP